MSNRKGGAENPEAGKEVENSFVEAKDDGTVNQLFII